MWEKHDESRMCTTYLKLTFNFLNSSSPERIIDESVYVSHTSLQIKTFLERNFLNAEIRKLSLKTLSLDPFILRFTGKCVSPTL